MTDKELLQQALDALESWQKTCLDCGRSSEELGRATKPLQAIRTRLAQPELEPSNNGKLRDVTIVFKDTPPYTVNRWSKEFDVYLDGKKADIYTAPPKKEWVGLTDDEITECRQNSYDAQIGLLPLTFVRALEAKLKEKNSD
jgi:hypothetical protein